MALYSSLYRITGLLTALVLSLAACAPPSNTITDADTKVRVDDRTTTDISPPNVFNRDSIGSTKIGDTFDSKKLNKAPSSFDRCFSAKNKAIPAADYLIIDDKVVKITIKDSDIPSASGVKIGDSLSQVYAKHQGQTPEIIDSPFSGPDDKLINMYYWTVEEGQRVGTRYDLNPDVVINISIGNEDGLMSQEGCV
ncbi:DUF1131 family protein [Psychrobacter sp. 72-O-c]|uniref:DUF1131 family protein n=1 Tax=Psychrobacter sp. 72-O-c TaxID=2774125 RepID=UPI0019189500|nr:DUF1131 family protein [Psychrobacter sp. 72-O-c]